VWRPRPFPRGSAATDARIVSRDSHFRRGTLSPDRESLAGHGPAARPRSRGPWVRCRQDKQAHSDGGSISPAHLRRWQEERNPPMGCQAQSLSCLDLAGNAHAPDACAPAEPQGEEKNETVPQPRLGGGKPLDRRAPRPGRSGRSGCTWPPRAKGRPKTVRTTPEACNGCRRPHPDFPRTQPRQWESQVKGAPRRASRWLRCNLVGAGLTADAYGQQSQSGGGCSSSSVAGEEEPASLTRWPGLRRSQGGTRSWCRSVHQRKGKAIGPGRTGKNLPGGE